MHVALLVTEISRQDQNFRIIPRSLDSLKINVNSFGETVRTHCLKATEVLFVFEVSFWF